MHSFKIETKNKKIRRIFIVIRTFCRFNVGVAHVELTDTEANVPVSFCKDCPEIGLIEKGFGTISCVKLWQF